MPWLRVVTALARAPAAGLILASRTRGLAAIVPISLALVAGLAAPLAYSIDTAATAHSGSIPTAGPTVTSASGGFPGGSGSPGGSGFPSGSGFPGGSRPGGSESGTSALSRGPGGGGSVSSALSRLLESGASGYRWAAATVGSTSAASLELSSNGVPVMAIGGFTGSDPAPTLAEFKAMVAAHEIHYFIAGGVGGGGGIGGAGSSDASQI